MKHFLLITILFSVYSLTYSQEEEEYNQNIRGTVTDKESGYPLAGVTVAVVSTSPQKGAITNDKGEFVIKQVPVGRHTVMLKLVGYDQVILNNQLVTSGKELILNVEMIELVQEQEDIELKLVEDKKGEVKNKNTSVSTRTFSIEETSRYAASRNDPARMAQNFAGVSQGNDSRNDIIIRGNSPLGIQWRMDGIVIPNPNHFGAFGTTGGPVNIINNNVLDNSDFLTGAFPAEYGNVLAGVFDLNMRKGNSGGLEAMAQMGFNGLELGVEGPFKKESASSFVANYRYSTLELFDLMGISFGTVAIPEYQDLSFKLNFPTEKAGVFSVFGVGGISKIEFLGSELGEDDLFSERSEDVVFKSGTGVVGLSHLYFLNEKASVKTNLAVSGITNLILVDSITYDSNSVLLGTVPEYRNHFDQVKYTFNSNYNHKFDAKNNVTGGFTLDMYNFNLVDSALVDDGSTFFPIRNFDGGTLLSQAYLHWQHKFSNNTTLNTGVHAQHLSLNNSFTLEPRIGIRSNLDDKQTISFGTSLHSQIQPFQIYFLEDEVSPGNYVRTNEELDYTRAAHLMLGYDRSISSNVRFKAEAYYQYIYNAPVESEASSYSILNAGADFGISSIDSLVNEGTGRNFGVELTLERFFAKNYYFLSTLSLYDSKYKGSDGVLRNTAFNGSYVYNLLAGKEFNFNSKSALIIDLKVTYAGGKRYTPVDVDESIAEGETVFDDSKAFSEQFDPYFRPDIKISFRRNGKKATQEWALDIQNFIGRKNIFSQEFDVTTGEVKTNYQLGFFPVGQYRILF